MRIVLMCGSRARLRVSSFSPWSLNSWSRVRRSNFSQASNTPCLTLPWSLLSCAQKSMSNARWGMGGLSGGRYGRRSGGGSDCRAVEIEFDHAQHLGDLFGHVVRRPVHQAQIVVEGREDQLRLRRLSLGEQEHADVPAQLDRLVAHVAVDGADDVQNTP